MIAATVDDSAVGGLGDDEPESLELQREVGDHRDYGYEETSTPSAELSYLLAKKSAWECRRLSLA